MIALHSDLEDHRGHPKLVEQPLEPAHELCLGQAELGLGGDLAGELMVDTLQFGLQVGRDGLFQLGNGPGEEVDRNAPGLGVEGLPAGLV